MRRRLHSSAAWRRARAEDGFTMIELLAAFLILTSGITALVGTLDGSRDLTNQSELKQAAVHRAEREIERIQSLDFEKVAHPPGDLPGAATSGSDDPKSRIVAPTSGSEYSFKWNRKDDAKSEALVTADEGEVRLTDIYEDGRFNGDVHRFVTWTRDSACGTTTSPGLCEEARSYKRITVVVRVKGLRNDVRAIWFSSIVSDPKNGTVDSSTGPVTECLNAAGDLEECANSGSEVPRSFYLYDTPANLGDVRRTPSESHPSHPNVVCATGMTLACPMPDLMGEDRPAGDQQSQLSNYSTDVSGGYTAGRAIRRDSACSETPSASDNTKGAFWAAPLESQGVALTGKGALSLYSHTLGGVSAPVTICLAVYSVDGDLSAFGTSSPTELGRTSYALGTWPKTPTKVSFGFQFSEQSKTVAAGRRIGVRVWIAGSASADVALMYDHPSYASYVQLNQPGS